MKILVLCTYPICEPRHGGQLRVRNIVDAYTEAGHDVEVAGVLGSDQYGDEKGFVLYPGVSELSSVINNVFLMEDYAIGRLFSEDEKYFNKLKKLINQKPDIIQVEHPWLFSFAYRYVREENLHSKLIYSSHNIEYLLKKDIIASYSGETLGQDCSDLIKKMEEFAIKNSDLIYCVSDNDKKWLKSKTDKEVVLAPNGVSDWVVSDVGRREALGISGNYRYALYCASAHPPNMTGFFNMFGGGFGSLKPDEKLIIAGGASWSIAGDIRIHHSAKLAEKVVIGGIVSQPCLEGLLDSAHCIVLPLTQGGGTNLKTAEALWSGKHIIATSIAMRGFEEFKNSPGVYIADNSSDFKQRLRHAMAEPKLSLSLTEIDKRKTVLWLNCLKPLVQHLENLKKY